MLCIWVVRRYKAIWRSLPDKVTQWITVGDGSRVKNDQKATIELRDLKRRMDQAERCHEKTTSEISLLKDMGASLSANALNQTLARVCEVPETGLAESQPLVPLSSTMTSNPASRPMIIPNTTGLMSRSSRR